MPDEDKLERLCRGCGKHILSGSVRVSGRDDNDYCSQCMMDRAERYIKEIPVGKPKLQRLRKTLAWEVSMVLIIIICFGIIFYQGPRIWTAFKEPKPIRMGSHETDEVTDECIKNLWKIASLIQKGHPVAGQTLVCPASGKPYLIKSGTNAEAHCPNPASHGFRDIIVTKKTPVPELKKLQ